VKVEGSPEFIAFASDFDNSWSHRWVEYETDVLLRYLETHGEVDDGRLPGWDEFQGLAADYKIKS
jgi:hypothetical protein